MSFQIWLHSEKDASKSDILATINSKVRFLLKKSRSKHLEAW